MSSDLLCCVVLCALVDVDAAVCCIQEDVPVRVAVFVFLYLLLYN